MNQMVEFLSTVTQAQRLFRYYSTWAILNLHFIGSGGQKCISICFEYCRNRDFNKIFAEIIKKYFGAKRDE
jgi:hypothetical protein